MDTRISVVVPVYNAREYVEKAVESALQQKETRELLLVEDGSADGSLEVCRRVAQTSPKVRLLRHPDSGNHGPGASRNLGIQCAVSPWIAFLDADDYYLPRRFATTTEMLRESDNVDGVYEAVGAHFETDADRDTFLRTPLKPITTINARIEPERLFEACIRLGSGAGYFHLDGLTVRKTLLDKIGGFNADAMFHQDTELFFKLIALGRLVPGDIVNPVAVRRVHGKNRITHHLINARASHATEIESWEHIYRWGKKALPRSRRYLVALRFLDRLRKVDLVEDASLTEVGISRRRMIEIARDHPRLAMDIWFWRFLLPSRALLRRFVRSSGRVLKTADPEVQSTSSRESNQDV